MVRSSESKIRGKVTKSNLIATTKRWHKKALTTIVLFTPETSYLTMSFTTTRNVFATLESVKHVCSREPSRFPKRWPSSVHSAPIFFFTAVELRTTTIRLQWREAKGCFVLEWSTCYYSCFLYFLTSFGFKEKDVLLPRSNKSNIKM